MSDTNNNPGPIDDTEDKGQMDRSPSSLSVASAQSMKWDSTADFLEYSNTPIAGTSLRRTETRILHSGRNPLLYSEEVVSQKPPSPPCPTFESNMGGAGNISPDSSSSVSQTKTYTHPGRSTPSQSSAPSPSFAPSPISIERKDVGVSVSISGSSIVEKEGRDFNQQCNPESVGNENTEDSTRMVSLTM